MQGNDKIFDIQGKKMIWILEEKGRWCGINTINDNGNKAKNALKTEYKCHKSVIAY